MLVPLRRESFRQIIPLVATGPQYAYYWGKPADFLQRILISFVGALILWICKIFGPDSLSELALLFIGITLLYWLWGPVYWASIRNASYRKYPYSGFWRGEVCDVFISEEVVREEQTVNKKGELVILETIEKRINIEAVDESGFKVKTQAPLRRLFKKIRPGQIAEALILSSRDDLSRIECISDLYLPQENLWVGDYPYLRRDLFSQMSLQLASRRESNRRARYNNIN
jgi:hypothetical protein